MDFTKRNLPRVSRVAQKLGFRAVRNVAKERFSDVLTERRVTAEGAALVRLENLVSPAVLRGIVYSFLLTLIIGAL